MTSVLRVLQVVMILTWCWPLIVFAKYAWRKATGPHDTLRAAMWSMSLAVCLFPIWSFLFGGRLDMMAPLELAVRCATYVLAILAAGFLTLAVWDVSRGH